MSTAPGHRLLSVEEYLAIEERSEVRHEFHRGEMFAMAGATREHSLIAGNLFRAIGNALEDRPCEVYASDMRVLVEATGLYTYSDVAVVCGEPRFADDRKTILLNPTVLFEVLSPSTETYDRGTKFGMYQDIESLREYVLVSLDRPQVEVYRRGKGEWIYRRMTGRESSLRLDSIDVEIPLREVYDRITFAPTTINREIETP